MAETLHAHQRLSSQEFAYQRAWRRGRPAERFVDKRSFSANPRNNRRGWVLECASLSECTNAPLTAHGCLQGSSDCIRRRSSKQGWETFNNLLYLGKVQVTRKRYSMSQRMRHLIFRNRMVPACAGHTETQKEKRISAYPLLMWTGFSDSEILILRKV